MNKHCKDLFFIWGLWTLDDQHQPHSGSRLTVQNLSNLGSSPMQTHIVGFLNLHSDFSEKEVVYPLILFSKA